MNCVNDGLTQTTCLTTPTEPKRLQTIKGNENKIIESLGLTLEHLETLKYENNIGMATMTEVNKMKLKL